MRALKPWLAGLASLAGQAHAVERITSAYTDLSACPIVEEDPETGSFSRICGGVSGFKLKVLFDDERMSIDVLSPDKQHHALDYWEVVTPSFFHLGEKAEWRVRQRHRTAVPTALIVKAHVLEQQEGSTPRRFALLVVAKIQDDAVCVTDLVETAQASANRKARALADQSHGKPCLGPPIPR